jgi:hypothetical protein
MNISANTTRTVTITLEGKEIEDIETICRDYLAACCDAACCDDDSAENTAKNILKSLEGPEGFDPYECRHMHVINLVASGQLTGCECAACGRVLTT